MNDYKNNEILQLKMNLMGINKPKKRYSINDFGEKNLSDISHNSKISDIVEKEISKKINGKIGILFEDNIRKSLEINLDWKEGKIKREFFYREISFKNQKKKYIICPNKNTYFITKKREFIISFKEVDKSCEILNKNTGEIVKKIEEQNNVEDVKILNKILSIGIPKQLEIDGLYQVEQFKLSMFDEKEIEILYSNIKENQDFSYVAIEIKLNQNKIYDIIQQLIDDKKVLKKIIKKHILYLGIVNYEKQNYIETENLNSIIEASNFYCLILGIKNGIFFQRKVTESIDWKLVSDFKNFKWEIEKKIDTLSSLLLKKLKREEK